MSDKLLALRFEDNWADEMDVAGIWIVKKSEWEAYKSEVTENFGLERSISIGTNEEIEYSDVEDYLKKFKEMPMTQPQIMNLRVCLGKDIWGNIPLIEDFDE